jgi:hypothetical protein
MLSVRVRARRGRYHVRDAEQAVQTASSFSIRLQRALRDYVLHIAEDSLAVGMAQGPVPWPERVNCSLRYDADSSNVAHLLTAPGGIPVPGDGPARGAAAATSWLRWKTRTVNKVRSSVIKTAVQSILADDASWAFRSAPVAAGNVDDFIPIA